MERQVSGLTAECSVDRENLLNSLSALEHNEKVEFFMRENLISIKLPQLYSHKHKHQTCQSSPGEKFKIY